MFPPSIINFGGEGYGGTSEGGGGGSWGGGGGVGSIPHFVGLTNIHVGGGDILVN